MPTLLLVAASPLDQDRLRLGAEFRDIRNALQRSRNREEWKIESNEAVTVGDLRRALLDYRPTILHFSGHGGDDGGLCFEDAEGDSHSTDVVPLASLLHLFKNNLKCVVLNACHSYVQADAVRGEIDNVIGMRAAVDDDSAKEFAVSFYDAVFAGTDFRMAFDLGCSALDLKNLPDSDAPVFMTGAHLENTELSYTSRVPEVERVLFSYLNSPFTDRAVFTTTGEECATEMIRHYGEHMRRNVDKVQVQSMDAMDDDRWRVAVDITAGEDRQTTTIFYLRIRDRNVLVEWEASVGLWSVPVTTYLALGSDEPVIARVKAELDDYYNVDFSDQQHRFQSVRLHVKSGQMLHGYVDRQSAVYDDLLAILSDGNVHSITLEICQVGEDRSVSLIQRILSSTWLYAPTNDGE